MSYDSDAADDFVVLTSGPVTVTLPAAPYCAACVGHGTDVHDDDCPEQDNSRNALANAMCKFTGTASWFEKADNVIAALAAEGWVLSPVDGD